MRISVDESACDGFGLCAMDLPEHFDFDDDTAKSIVTDPELPDGVTEQVQRVVANCPVRAIHIIE